jgi:hypothetical protein
MEELNVTVTVKLMDGRSHIFLTTPNNQRQLSVEEIGKILAGGLSLTIRSSDNEGKFMGEIMNYLTKEFVNVDSFKDAKNFL